jgi:hypothetical protein
MAMNKEELIKHKEGLEAELQADELALQRIKARVEYQRKYIKLLSEQIELLGETTAEEITGA